MSRRKSFDSDYFLVFWEKNQKKVITIVSVIIIAVVAWFAYTNLIAKPKAERANNALSNVQNIFQQAIMSPTVDTAAFKAVINGEGAIKGALSIINDYGSTPAGNLANYYVGASYLHIGDFNNAVKYLKVFNTDQKQIQMMAYGALGDAYSELKKNDDAIATYKKAANTFADDDVNASEYLFRAAMLSELSGKTKEAVDLYKELKDKFPNTEKGTQADKYLNRLAIQPIN